MFQRFRNLKKVEKHWIKNFFKILTVTRLNFEKGHKSKKVLNEKLETS